MAEKTKKKTLTSLFLFPIDKRCEQHPGHPILARLQSANSAHPLRTSQNFCRVKNYLKVQNVVLKQLLLSRTKE